jgi:hypothetical protein
MCAGCALAAMTGATGARAWLQAHHLTWLTPRRMRAATIAMFVAATLVSSIGISGSSAPAKHPAAPAQSSQDSR